MERLVVNPRRNQSALLRRICSRHRLAYVGFSLLSTIGLGVSAADPANRTSGGQKSGAPQTAIKEAAPLNAAIPSDGDPNAAKEDLPKPPIDDAHPLYLPLQEAYKARNALALVKDYDAVLVKREMIGRRLLKATMNLKLREEPRSFYLKFVEPNAGREVIYNEGRLNNQMQIHEAGFKSLVGTVLRAPNAPDVMAENRYPANMVGLKVMLDKVIKQWEEEGKFGEIETKKYPDARLPTGEACVAYESLHPVPRDQFKFHITRLWIDTKTGLAIRVEQLGFPQKGDKQPPVLEEYTYGAIRTNLKLTDADFDVRNKAYQFQ